MAILETLLVVYGIVSELVRVDRIAIGAVVLAYCISAVYLARSSLYRIAANMLVSLYLIIATGILLFWGINAASGLLMLGFVIFLSGVTLGRHYILPLIAAAVGLLVVIHHLHDTSVLIPAREVLGMPSHFGDILTYGSLFAIFGVTSWIATNNIYLWFKKATLAEAKLRSQKATLAKQLERESKRLKETQLEETKQLYRFAEVGQSTVATLHELANHLSVLQLDIDDIAEANRRHESVDRARESIKMINSLIINTRTQIQQNREIRPFTIPHVLRQTVTDHQKYAKQYSISLRQIITSERIPQMKGDELSFHHVISILIRNAIDACKDRTNSTITVELGTVKNAVQITVSDNGPGISPDVAKKLFEPKVSTKESGLGIGLYIAHTIVTTQFRGTIVHKDAAPGTTFVITIPLT